jgi:hypothetical protein
MSTVSSLLMIQIRLGFGHNFDPEYAFDEGDPIVDTEDIQVGLFIVFVVYVLTWLSRNHAASLMKT